MVILLLEKCLNCTNVQCAEQIGEIHSNHRQALRAKPSLALKIFVIFWKKNSHFNAIQIN